MSGPQDESESYFRSLQDNWDGEGAPAPCSASIDQALELKERLGTLVIGLGADVLGGMGVYFAWNEFSSVASPVTPCHAWLRICNQLSWALCINKSGCETQFLAGKPEILAYLEVL